MLTELTPQINALARVKCTVSADGATHDGCAQEACEGADMFITVKGYVDIDVQTQKLEKALEFLSDKVASETAFLESEHAGKMDEVKLAARKDALDAFQADLAAKSATLARYRRLQQSA